MSGIINATNLEVANIKDSTGTNTAMTVDSSGRVTTPTRPSFKVRRRNNAGSQTQLTGSDIFKTGQTNGQIIVDYNIGSHFSNGRFTCPVAGIYQFTAIGLISDASGAVAGGNYTLLAYFTKNGETNSDVIDDVQMYHYHQSGNAGGYPYFNYTDTYQLAANDVIGFRIQTGGFYINNSDYYAAKFMGHLIG